MSIPTNSSVVIPMLICRDVPAEINVCNATFGAIDLGSRPGSDGVVAHAFLTINDTMIIIEAEWPTLASRAPLPDGSSSVVIFVYVENVDDVVERPAREFLFPYRINFGETARPGL